jgi:hypothetical protein
MSISTENIRQEIRSLWLFFYEIFVEPLLLGFILFILFPRIQAVMESTSNGGLWARFNVDIATHPLPYVLFFVVFALWMIGKGMRHKHEQTENKKMNDTLSNQTQILVEIKEQLVKLNKRMNNGQRRTKNKL